jgi:hypothetical protein
VEEQYSGKESRDEDGTHAEGSANGAGGSDEAETTEADAEDSTWRGQLRSEANAEERVSPQDILSSRRALLIGITTRSFDESSHQTKGFALRVCGESVAELTWHPVSTSELTYGGYPALAYRGYAVADDASDEGSGENAAEFLERTRQLLARPGGPLDHLSRDDVALLGLTDGIAALRLAGHDVEADVQRLVAIIEPSHQQSVPSLGQGRLRLLAAELLDPRGRLSSRRPFDEVDGGATELALRQTWPSTFGQAPGATPHEREQLLGGLLRASPPEIGELERAACWLRALDALVADVARELTPSEEDVVRLLRRTQTGLKRWVMEYKQRRGAPVACRWWIDNEYHVQSLLWAVLYPVFGGGLLDEEYVPSAGMKQPRVDLCVLPLRLIIEVKFVRQARDFAEVEEQVAGDLGVYFTDPRFDRLIAYVYDDTEQGHPEEHGRLRDALMSRDSRVVDVVVVQRPGHIPSRSQRREPS